MNSFESAGAFAGDAYDIDDAFSDSEDPVASFHLNPETIRAELSKSMPQSMPETDTATTATANGFFEARDTSVSTLDINGLAESASGSSEYFPSHSRPDTPEDEDHFSMVSLTTSESNSIPLAKTEDADFDIEIPIILPSETAESLDSTTQSQRTTSSSNENSPEIPSTSTPSTSPPSTPVPWHMPPPSSPPPHSASPSPQLSPVPQASASTSTQQTIVTPPPMSLSSGSVSPTAPSHVPPPPPRHNRSAGPSLFEKVRSKTRPSFLPPKNRKEDQKHLADWQAMMKQSRVAAEKRRKALQDRRATREKKIEESLHIWEKEIMPDWRVVHKNPAMRHLWWKGIPTKLRASMWERAVGNPLALSKDNYRLCLARAKRALTSNTFPHETLAQIESDIASTLPALHIFLPDIGPLYGDLKDMLCAWVVSRSDEGLGYTPGVSRVAAMFLITMPPQQGFVVMRNLLERHCMRSFYGGAATKDDVEAYYRIFDTLLADGMPKIYFNFKQHQISPSSYLPDWLVPLFLDHLPFEACARIWDVILLEGDAFLYRAALAMLAVLESRLFFPDRKELMELLKGENKAALEVARREGQALNGGKYEIYGVDEETLWERIESMEDWWKESTWTRLIQRELPDI